MQYILAESELLVLKERATKLKLEHAEKLQEFCTRVADEMPILFWGRTVPEPWGCILTRKGESYCDECPAKGVCPYEWKAWSQ